MDDHQLLPPPKKSKRISQIGCLSCLENLPLGPNPIPVLQLVFYVVAVILGMFVCIPMGIVLRRFTGSCILYAQVVWDGKTIWPWAETSCDYTIYANLATNVIFSTLMCLFLLLFLHPKYDEEDVQGVRHLTKLFKYSNNYVIDGINPMVTVIHIVIWCHQVAGSIMLSVGFAETCRWLEESLKESNNKITTCEEASRRLDWSEYTIIREEDEDGVKGYGFYAALTITSLASWLLVGVWTLQLILNFGQICTRCSCEMAEEKVKITTTSLIAARRSRLATPIGTPGGRHTPVPIGQSIPPYRPMGMGPPPGQGMGPPPSQQGTFMLQQPPQRYPGQSDA